jgi:hypothetical protein
MAATTFRSESEAAASLVGGGGINDGEEWRGNW